MIGWTQYRKHPERFWQGKKVRTLYKIESGVQAIPKGTILTIKSKHNGFTLEAPQCPHCQVSVYIRKVDPGSLELAE